MSDTLDPIMQAAERLRRYRAYGPDDEFVTFTQVYGPYGEISLMLYNDDISIVEQFALSVLPKGKRPVETDVTGLPMGTEVYAMDDFTKSVVAGEMRTFGGKPRAIFDSNDQVRVKAFTDEADARLALRWQRLDELMEDS